MVGGFTGYRRLMCDPNPEAGGGNGDGTNGNNPPTPPANPPANPNQGNGNNPPNPNNPLNLSPEQQTGFDRATGEARRKGREAALSELLAELKVADKAALIARIQDVDKLTSAHDTEITALNGTLDKTKVLLVKATVRELATQKGLDPAKVIEFMETTGGFGSFEVDVDKGEVKGITKAIESLAGMIPAKGKTPPKIPSQSSGNGGDGSKPTVGAASTYLQGTYGNIPGRKKD
jgi:hypothetical protein